MRICILTEGSYPYVLGGVSSWIHTMILNCPQHEFIVYVVYPESSKKGQYKYDIPSNVVEIVEVFLDEIDLSEGKSGKKYRFKDSHKKAIQNLLEGNEVDWKEIFEFFKEKNFTNVGEFFMSKNFYNIVQEAYKNKYQYTPFTEFLWNIRSMYLILFFLLMKDIPKADLYHSICTGYSGVLASYAKYLYGTPFILSEHGIYTREREEEIIRSTWIKSYHKDIWNNFFKSLSKCAYESSDEVTSLFKKNKEMQIALGCPEDKIKIIPNGIDIEKYLDLKGKEDDEFINIGGIVRVVPIKDIKTMLLSFKIVKESIANSRLYVMGPCDEDEEYYNECLEFVKEHNIKDVIFTGTIPVLDYIGKMDILLLTSISEGQPLAVMEGMAAKKPHVCTNVGHCRGLLDGDGDDYGSNGYIEYVTNHHGIAKAVIKLARDEKLRERLGQNGFNRINNLYKRKYMLEEYKKLYSKHYERNRKWQE